VQSTGGVPPLPFEGMVTDMYLIPFGRRFLGDSYAFESAVDAGYYFVLSLVDAGSKWAAVIYNYSK
jgi:hypothetical protein